jgi:cholesterol oxidase
VLEAGKRFTADDFPTTSWDLRRFLWFPRLGMRGIQRITLLRHVLVLSGAGVGGGSLVYANTLYEPHDAFYADPQWAGITDWKTELAPYYGVAKRMLGVVTNPGDTPADEVMRVVARHFGAEDTFTPTPVGVFFGEPGVEVPDPYFGGAGPARSGCISCGACMVGCRHGAKNSLDRNYLYLAERNGAAVHPEHEVTDLEALPGGGYRVTTQRPGAWLRKRQRTFTAEQVVFSAGALGTLRLLARLRDEGRLPTVSDRLGHHVRTNSEAILGATTGDTSVDYSRGVAITSSIHPEPHTHIEPVRYGKGSNSMGMLATVLVDGGGRVPRWVRFLATVVRHPVLFARSLSLRRWSERSVILLVMQSLDNSLRVFRKKGLFGERLSSRQEEGKPNPTYIPIANEAARVAADAMGGFPGSAVNEVLLDVPTTAHIIGGACIGNSPATGVIDPYHRLHGFPGLHVADGSAVSANLGVNPSLTITAVQVAPSTLEGICRFLGTGRVRGIGPTIAGRLVEAFELETLDVLDREPERLLEIRGIGPATLDKIRGSWQKHRGIQQVMIFLTGHGIAPGIAVKAYARYGAAALEVVRDNPYRLAEEVVGVGFRTADRIARNTGVPGDAPQRLEAGVLFALNEAAVEGHVYLPRTVLLEQAAALLEVDPSLLAPALTSVEQRGLVVVRPREGDEDAVYGRRLETAEATLAADLLALLATAGTDDDLDADRAVEWCQQREAVELSGRQRQALRAALTGRVVVITGGPGTGKTTLVRSLTRVLEARERPIQLAAPTGRAAKRMEQATGVPARTIHRLLEFNPKSRSFGRNRENPVEADMLVVDEVSMLDVELAADLLEAVPPGCRLVLVGDADQLPSVGPGNVLRDLIASGVVPVVRLDRIFRQAERSRIVVNAHRINAGRMPVVDGNEADSDFFFIARDDPAEARRPGGGAGEPAAPRPLPASTPSTRSRS